MSPSGSPGADIRALLGHDEFHARHIGPTVPQEAAMLAALGFESRAALVRATVPANLLIDEPLALGEPVSEREALAELRELAGRNQVWRSYIGAGYHGTITPEPIRRNVLENPGWYARRRSLCRLTTHSTLGASIGSGPHAKRCWANRTPSVARSRRKATPSPQSGRHV